MLLLILFCCCCFFFFFISTQAAKYDIIPCLRKSSGGSNGLSLDEIMGHYRAKVVTSCFPLSCGMPDLGRQASPRSVYGGLELLITGADRFRTVVETMIVLVEKGGEFIIQQT
jgi:hypothetical protein